MKGKLTTKVRQSLHPVIMNLYIDTHAREECQSVILGQFQVIHNDLLPCFFRVRRNHRHMTDAGYGSRIGAASKMANAFVGKLALFLVS